MFFFNFSFAQTKNKKNEKNEKEERISFSLMPKKAKGIISELPVKVKRLKFYKESDGKHQSYEAKFKYKKRWYSLEFSTDGSIEDLEFVVSYKDISIEVNNAINVYFGTNFIKTNVLKIQKQLIYNTKQTSKEFLTQIFNSKTLISNYEIIAEVSDKQGTKLKEFTFDEKGQLISIRLVIQPEYEHILY